jgi:hypothetical protein
LLDGYHATSVIVAACRLALFDRLSARPRPIEDLARDVGASPENLRRLLRALIGYGLVEAADDGVSLTEDGHFFLSNEIGSDRALLVGEQYLPAWAELSQSVVSGRPAFQDRFRMSAWAHRERHPTINDAFNRAIQKPQAAATAELVRHFDFSRYPVIADVGGGNGYLLEAVLTHYAGVKGILFDQPHVAASARRRLSGSVVDGRCAFVEGSFFDDVPAGADLYVLQYILHDWNDDASVAILRRCRAAMRRGAKLLILEKCLPSNGNAPLFLVLRDLHMMTVLGGQERTPDEYRQLLSSADLELDGVTSLPPFCPDILDCSPRAD